ncbi:MAG: MFS transporter, partial [Mucilaginibacter polytrichastri]|nr:MFS transporter [Mucilaginibacter polytrichastri]
LGLLLLILRVSVAESGMFTKTRQSNAERGNFLYLFTHGKRFIKYLQCIIIGMPLWFVVGILITLSPEFGKVLGVQGEVNAGAAVACCYGGLVVGDIISGSLSQYLKSRIRVVYIFLFLAIAAITTYFALHNLSLTAFYSICFLVGLCVGYWVIFMTIAAEQFGTNIRATVTTTVPNFVRGAVVPMTLLFSFLKGALSGDIVLAAIIVGVIVLALCFWALHSMEETFSKDLDYEEA